MNTMNRNEEDTNLRERIAGLEAELKELRARLGSAASPSVHVSGIDIEWSPEAGVCTFAELPVAMMWVESTLAGLMSGVEAMVGTERFLLALQSEGRKSVEADWTVISGFDRFEDGFRAIANIAAVAGWGRGELVELNEREELQRRLHRSRQMESLGLLAGGVAHDLNNILSGLVTYPDFLLMGLSSEDRMFKPLQIIAESGSRAAAVVKDLLTITRASATSKTTVNLNDLVRDHLQSPEFRILGDDHAGVVVEEDLAGEPLLVVGSDGHLRKAVTNLVFNAAEACEGKGRVTVRTRRRSLDRPRTGFERIEPGDYVVLTVKDDGAGIAEQDLERIFEPFYSRKVLGRSGTGLGLTVVWNTVRDHQGFIDIESDPTGTVFHLYLPASTESVLKTATRLSLDELKGHGESVLIIDDEEQQRVIVSGMLGKLGYVARAVPSGADALTALAEEPADLLILDMIMPGSWGGAETYRRILAEHPGQRAIIASGFAETDDVRAAMAAGAGAFLHKPYSLEQLAVAIRNELGAAPAKGDDVSTP